MAQQLQSYGQGPYAEEALRLAEIGRGQEGMSRTAAPVGPNLADGGGMSKPNVNTQPYNNERLASQNMQQNVLSAGPQAASNAVGGVRAQVAAQSDAEGKAQQFAAQRMSEALYANQSGSALMRLNAVMQSPDKAKFMNDIATGKAMAQGLNPDLGQEVAQARQYG